MTSEVFSHAKLCPKCGIEKSVSEFSKCKSRKDGLQHQCKQCKKMWRETNREHRSIINKLWREENEYHLRDYIKRWKKTNSSIVAASSANYRATKLQATPSWSETMQIKHIYAQSKNLSRITGIKHHVDHIVPLVSELVCGLHCLANLQILTANENCSKNNLSWPDMPS